MEEQNTISREYQKRFNEGYALAKYMPEVAETLAQSLKDNDRGQGFRDGRNQYLREQLKEKLPSRLSNQRQSLGVDKQPDRTKGQDIEPET